MSNYTEEEVKQIVLSNNVFTPFGAAVQYTPSQKEALMLAGVPLQIGDTSYWYMNKTIVQGNFNKDSAWFNSLSQDQKLAMARNINAIASTHHTENFVKQYEDPTYVPTYVPPTPSEQQKKVDQATNKLYEFAGSNNPVAFSFAKHKFDIYVRDLKKVYSPADKDWYEHYKQIADPFSYFGVKDTQTMKEWLYYILIFNGFTDETLPLWWILLFPEDTKYKPWGGLKRDFA